MPTMPLFRKSPASQEILEPPNAEEDLAHQVDREELVLLSAPVSRTAEQFRRMRNSLQALNPDGAARSIMMTSATDGEGKTVATLNLGLAMAELEHVRVLVADGNILNPSVEEYIGLPRRQGLADILQARLTLDQAIRKTSTGLDILGAGTPPDNLASLLNIDRLKSVIHSIKRRYDYLLIDAPAVLSMNHPSVVGAVTDGILLVVGIGKSAKPQVEEAFNMLEHLGGNVLGTCVTHVGGS